jgi:hypothetical protein
LIISSKIIVFLFYYGITSLIDIHYKCFREAELEEDSEYFIGPAPPAVVAEVASSNEAERFEEVLSFPSGIINTVLSFTKFMDSVFARVPTHTSCINR